MSALADSSPSDGKTEAKEGIYKLKLIDFANVFTPLNQVSEDQEGISQMRSTTDEDLIKGVSNLISLLQALLSSPHILDDESSIWIDIQSSLILYSK